MDSTGNITLRLVKGASLYRAFTLNPACAKAMFRVGSAAECNWQVCAPGVAGHHLMLLWKAGELTLVDVGAGNLWVDGEPIHWSRRIVTGYIAFAEAGIVVERTLETAMPATRGVAGIDAEFDKNS